MPAAPGRFQSRSQSQWISGMTLEIWKNRQDSAGHFSWAAGDVTGMPSKALSKLGGLFSWAVVHFTEIGEIVDFRPKIRWTKKLLQQSLCSLQMQISYISSAFWNSNMLFSVNSDWRQAVAQVDEVMEAFSAAQWLVLLDAQGTSWNCAVRRPTSAARTRPRHLPTSLSHEAGAAGWLTFPRRIQIWHVWHRSNMVKQWSSWIKTWMANRTDANLCGI